MCDLWLCVLNNFETENIEYCVLRDGCELVRSGRHVEVDILIDSEHLSRVNDLLGRLGFVRLRRWGYSPHNFFVGYDADSDCWLKLDVVTRVSYGRPVHALDTSMGINCLRNRRRSGPGFIPSPEDELVTLLMHCIVDKLEFSVERRQRIRMLRDQVTAVNYVSKLLATYWSSSMTWIALNSLIDDDRWEFLKSQRPTIARVLASNRRWATACRYVRDRVLRKLHSKLTMLHPQSLTVALLAPDGAGKSTAVRGVSNTFYFPTRQIYMGLYGARSCPRGPLRLPGLGLITKCFVQWGRYLVARYHQARGCLVLFDRYTYDALLPSRRRRGGLARIRSWILAHVCPAPDLILVLDAPGETLFARKGEHDVAHLEKQRQAYRTLQQRFSQMEIVDATRDAERVRRDIVSCIWRGYANRAERRSWKQMLQRRR